MTEADAAATSPASHGTDMTEYLKADGTPEHPTPAEIAWVCHEANRAYCQTQGDDSQRPWADAPNWQRMSAIKGVLFLRDHPDAPPSAQHEAWLREKEDSGWSYGPTKDEVKKQHPCLLPYDQLPLAQRRKDFLFQAVVKALTRTA